MSEGQRQRYGRMAYGSVINHHDVTVMTAMTCRHDDS